MKALKHTSRLSSTAMLLPLGVLIGCPSAHNGHEGHDHGSNAKHGHHVDGTEEDHAEHDHAEENSK